MPVFGTKIIFLPGNNGGKEPGGASHDYWYPWAAREFERRGCTVVLKDFPDPMLARKSIWLPFLRDACGADEHSILIGHSSGAIAAMRYVEERTVLGSVLVGAYWTDLGDACEKVSGYFDGPWNSAAIVRNQQWIIQFASVDDPFIPAEESRTVHERLQTEYYEYENRGHFFDAQFPELVEAVKRRVGETQ